MVFPLRGVAVRFLIDYEGRIPCSLSGECVAEKGHPGGEDSQMKGAGMLVLKETDLGVAQAFFDP